MVIRSQENSIGAWAFFIGIILTILVGIFSRESTNSIILVGIMIFGVIVGAFVTEKNSSTFLLACVATVIASFAGIQGFAANISLRGAVLSGVGVGAILVSILNALLFFLVPATIIASLKLLFSISKV